MLPNWLGDVVMATPTLRALRAHYGSSANLIGIVRPKTSDVLSGTHWFDQFIYFDPRSKRRDWRSWAVSTDLRKKNLEEFILLTNSWRAGAIALASRAKRRIGYVRYGRGPLLTDRLYPLREGRRLRPTSAVDYYLEIARRAGATVFSRKLELFTTSEDECLADRVWRNHDLNSARRVVVLNTGGSYGPAKNWPVEYFCSLALRLVHELDSSVLVICGPAERRTAATIQRTAAHSRVHSLAEMEPSIGLTKACIRRSDLVVTTDSGPRHFAAAFSVPAVTLFGPTDPRWSMTYHPNEIHLQRDLPCRPCARRSCPLGHHRCMREVTVSAVFAAVKELLDSKQSFRPAQLAI